MNHTDVKKPIVHHGQRMDELFKDLTARKGIMQKQLCEDIGIRQSSLNYWQNLENFSPLIWRKLRPVLEKYNLNEDYISEESDKKEKVDNLTDERAFREEVLRMLKEIKEMIKGRI